MTDEEIAERLKKKSEVISYTEVVRYIYVVGVVKEIRDEMQATINRQNLQLAEKDAKIFAYEAIISNSNFKAVLPKAKEGEK